MLGHSHEDRALLLGRVPLLLQVKEAGLGARASDGEGLGGQAHDRAHDRLAAEELARLLILSPHEVLTDVGVPRVAEDAVRHDDQEPPARLQKLKVAVDE